MNGLTEFLLARVAEDEAAAEGACSFSGDETFQRDNYGHLTIQPARVRAECEAKRSILGDHKVVAVDFGTDGGGCECTFVPDYGVAPDSGPCQTVRYLALPYADHPDYRDEWKP